MRVVILALLVLQSQQNNNGAVVAATSTTNDSSHFLRRLQTCQGNDECATGSYCAAGECRVFGTCDVSVDCINPANRHQDDECSGHWDCQQEACVCIEDQLCPNGRDVVNCFAAPCGNELPTCDGTKVASCVDNYCGGCIAIMFDAAGNQVCGNNNNVGNGDDPTTPVVGSPCQSDADCKSSSVSVSATRDGFGDEDLYCSLDGTCRENGSCGSLADCSNPSNNFMMIECVGTKLCDEAGFCGIICCQDGDCDSDNLEVVSDNDELGALGSADGENDDGDEEDGDESRANKIQGITIVGSTLLAGLAVLALQSN
eukprot:CAMPEP_0117010844 /NCGR_PEP_ID=MMETSP0472-20121206/9452_1 /TAXON_ID=693140 ORGANISM="Tiarina fusus, Strain LIS" /NCGR_SAMPLE_ID=MMETSP0472 /ASSEMBLY_ACC=CAM_ASM_000603 /LENGTH=313 /DNA_ID=CAMNT_0004713475 /DNA_START=67 /DNA_END=1008 /DNA_ORIENTATION=+